MEETREKLVWKIDFKQKKNIVGFIFFCFFALIAIVLLIWAFIYCVTGVYKATNNFLIAFPILCLIIDFFIGRAILLSSQPQD